MKHSQSEETAENVPVNCQYVQPAPPPEPKKLELFIGGFDRYISQLEIYNYFARFGKISKYTFLGSAGYAFLSFKDESITKKMLQMHHPSPRFNVRVAGDRQTNFFLGRLSPTIKNDEIENYFSKFGYCRCDRVEGNLFGFLYLNVSEDLKKSIVGKHTICGITIDLKLKLSRGQICEKKAKGLIPGGGFETYTANALWVGHVDLKMSRDDFHSYLQQFGECKTHLKMHLDGTQNRGFGFVHFENAEDRDSFLKDNPTPFSIRPSRGRRKNCSKPLITGNDENDPTTALYHGQKNQPILLWTYQNAVQNQFLTYLTPAYPILNVNQSPIRQLQSFGNPQFQQQHQQFISPHNAQKMMQPKKMGVQNNTKTLEPRPRHRNVLQSITQNTGASVRYSPY